MKGKQRRETHNKSKEKTKKKEGGDYTNIFLDCQHASVTLSFITSNMGSVKKSWEKAIRLTAWVDPRRPHEAVRKM